MTLLPRLNQDSRYRAWIVIKLVYCSIASYCDAARGDSKMPGDDCTLDDVADGSTRSGSSFRSKLRVTFWHASSVLRRSVTDAIVQRLLCNWSVSKRVLQPDASAAASTKMTSFVNTTF